MEIQRLASIGEIILYTWEVLMCRSNLIGAVHYQCNVIVNKWLHLIIFCYLLMKLNVQLS